MWFLIALIGYFFLAVVFVLDKLILTKSVSRPVVYTFYSTIFMLAAFVLLPFGASHMSLAAWGMALVSGVAFGLGLWTMFVALKKSEASHIMPFLGAIITLSTLIISSFFLDEKLRVLQFVGIAILIFASLILSHETSKTHHGFNSAYIIAVLSGILFAISHTSAKVLYDSYDFITAFGATRGTTGLVGVALLFSPVVFRTLFAKKSKTAPAKPFVKKHTLSIVVSNKVLSIVGVVLIQFAIAAGSVTIVNAMQGVQYAFTFILIYLLTRFLPKILTEYFTRREVWREGIAICLTIVGLGFMIF